MFFRAHRWLPSCSYALAMLLSIIVEVESDADFESVRVRYDYNEASGRGGDPDGKYWHESIFHPHYDGRFTDVTLEYEDQRSNLSLLMQSYLFSMADLGAETWIIHGTLLGWWWNRQIMPWDSDIDVQMSASTIHFLASYYNMTVHTYQDRDYMLEINPNYVDGSFEDRLNVIDGRWIDVMTGLFIDITAVRPKPKPTGIVGLFTSRSSYEGMFASKDRHEEKVGDLFPLRNSIFEGSPVKVPYSYAKLLAENYGNSALTKTQYRGHRFNTATLLWEKVRKAGNSSSGQQEGEDNGPD